MVNFFNGFFKPFFAAFLAFSIVAIAQSPLVFAGTGCSPAHAECAFSATDNCDVRNFNAMNFAGGSLPNGINICNANRVVDCGGRALRGLGSGTGISDNGFSYATIRNCVLTDYSTGISVSNANGAIIKNNTVRNSNPSGFAKGIVLQYSSGSSISCNVLQRPGGSGLELLYVTNSGISNNIFNRSSFAGVSVQSSTRNTFNHNLLNEGGGMGFSLSSGDNNIFSSNTVLNNFGSGIRFSPSSGQSLNSNTVCYNAQDFNLYRSLSNTGSNNRCGTPAGWNDASVSGCTYACTNSVSYYLNSFTPIGCTTIPMPLPSLYPKSLPLPTPILR